MRKITAILLFITCISSGFAQSNPWLSSFEDAQKLSIATNKLIFIDFYASWCGPCKKMDQEAFADPEIKKILQDFVLLRLDFDNQISLRNKYAVRAIPYVFIVDSQGHVINKQKGYSRKSNVKNLLEDYNLNTSFLQRETVQYYKNQNYTTAMRLAKKYLDFSLFLDKEIRHDFLNIAETYLSYSEDLLDKKQSNFELMSQKIVLLELTSALYDRNYRKLDRGLRKIEVDKVDEFNKDVYNFLNYCLAYKNEDQKAKKKWEAEVLASSSSQAYMKRKDELFDLVK